MTLHGWRHPAQNRSAMLRDSLITALYFWQSHFSLIALVRERRLP
jgi:hypothetical protein